MVSTGIHNDKMTDCDFQRKEATCAIAGVLGKYISGLAGQMYVAGDHAQREDRFYFLDSSKLTYLRHMERMADCISRLNSTPLKSEAWRSVAGDSLSLLSLSLRLPNVDSSAGQPGHPTQEAVITEDEINKLWEIILN
jgi:hypothetical protein